MSEEFVKADQHADQIVRYMEKPKQDLARIQAALDNGVWNPNSGPLCKFCAVKQCEYNRSP